MQAECYLGVHPLIQLCYLQFASLYQREDLQLSGEIRFLCSRFRGVFLQNFSKFLHIKLQNVFISLWVWFHFRLVKKVSKRFFSGSEYQLPLWPSFDHRLKLLFKYIFRFQLVQIVNIPGNINDPMHERGVPTSGGDTQKDTILLGWCFPGGSAVKNLPANVGGVGSTPSSGGSPREENGNPLQYSCLENPMDREARQAACSPWGRKHSIFKSTCLAPAAFQTQSRKRNAQIV